MTMRLSLCNEVLSPMPFAEQCVYAGKLGYDGLEVAPYTLAEEPDRMSTDLVAASRRVTHLITLRTEAMVFALTANPGARA